MTNKVLSTVVAAVLGVGTLAGTAAPASAGHPHDLDCSDFVYYEDALEHLDAHPGDPDRLDDDGDGRPCELRPRRPVGEVFRDVLPGGTHTVAIETMAGSGVISGYADGTFRPRNPVTRGQMASLLDRALDFPAGTASFSDTAGSTHRTAIAALATAGVVGGFPDGTFRPDNPITRGQMATMLARAFELPTTGTASPFRDVAGTTHERGINALAAARPEPITTGFPDGTFRPDAPTPRDQTATFLHRALRNAASSSATGWTVTGVVDGDTIDVRSATGSVERVRLIGVDTPERGQCGFTEAAQALERLTAGGQVALVAGALDDRDRYGRLLRYVDARGTDTGARLIESGLAVARYDSRDGYGGHPRESAYVAADRAAPDRCP